MTWIADTLWDLLRRPSRRRRPAPAASRKRRPAPPRTAMQQRYDRLVAEMKATYGIRVRKWRTSTSGCAWEVRSSDGSVTRLVEAPYPRGPMSCSVFLHEIGHHAIGLHRYKPRCLEEYHAWRWALETMRQHGFHVTPAVQRRRDEALRYAVAKARRRGLRALPRELAAWG